MSKKEFKNMWFVVKDIFKESPFVVVCMLVSSVIRGIIPYFKVILMGYLIDAVMENRSLQEMLKFTLVLLGMECVLKIIGAMAREKMNERWEYAQEKDDGVLNEMALHMDYEYLEDSRIKKMRKNIMSGRYMGIRCDVLDCIDKSLTSISSVVAAIFVVADLFLSQNGDVLSTIAVFAVIILVVIVYYKLQLYGMDQNQKLRKEGWEAGVKYDHYLGILAEVETQKDLRIYNQQALIAKDLDAVCKNVAGIQKKAGKYRVLAEGVGVTSTAILSLIAYLFAGIKAYMGVLSVGNVVSYAAAVIQFGQSFYAIPKQLSYFKSDSSSIQDYVDFLSLSQRKYPGTIPLEKRRDNRFEVEFDHVSFKYPGSDEYTIKDLNLKFVIGDKMAIVGKNGSGKTTFIKLLCRLYDVTEGCIKVNGIDIRKYDYQEYLRLFAVVFQDFKMFAFPLGENIAGSRRVDEEKAKEALTLAGMGEKLSELGEAALNICIGKEFDDSGVTFSGGEKQKMAIARAIYKDAPFVIMDEPTAALDPLSECEVYAGFDKMVGRKTAIYISHRLSSCRFCNDILVFDKGTVVQRGSHETLENEEGLYRELWNAQAQYYAS